MKNTLSLRQICFMLIAYNAALKILIYPSLAAGQAGNDLIFPALFDLILQTVVIWSTAYLSSSTQKTFFQLIEGSLGSVVARVVYALFALYFALSAVVPISEQRLLVHDAFYDTIPSLYVFLPFFFFSVYAGAKSFANAGRCADICFAVFAVAVPCILAMSVGQGDYTNLLPVLKQPVKVIARGSLSSLFRFSESAFLLMFMGHYKYSKGDAAKLTLSYAAGGLIVLALMATFYSIYGPLTPSRTFMLNSISVFFPVVSFVGRLDLIALYALDTVVLFAVALNIQMSVHCLNAAFNVQKSALFSVAVNAALLTVTIILNNRSTALQQVAARWFFIPTLIFAYAVPLCCWALRRKR